MKSVEKALAEEEYYGNHATEDSQLGSRGGTVSFTGVHASYVDTRGNRRTVLADANFVIPSGTFATVVGPSGAGKSTVLKLIGGLHPADAGEVRIGDRIIKGPNPEVVTTVFQDSCLLPWRTVARNAALPLEVAGVAKRERERRARDVLSLVGMQKYADSYPSELSGGMKQRVAIARGLVVEPQVLLMDEPFSALDEQSRSEMGEELLRLWERIRATVVFVTHSLSEALFLSDRVLMLKGVPAKVNKVVRVDFPRPRTLALTTTAPFNEMRADLYELLQYRKSESGDDGA